MSAPGSARTMSPSDANEASTPPVVGSVSTVTNGMPAASRRASTTGMPASAASPVMTASRRPVFACAAAIRSGYGLLSTKPCGSVEERSASVSLNERGSARSSTRSFAPSLKWCPHLVHTLRFRASCLLNSISPQLGHCVQRCEGNSFGLLPNGLRSLMRREGKAPPAPQSSYLFRTVPAESNESRTSARADDRTGLGHPVLHAVEALLDPVRERERALRIVRVHRAGVDARPGRDPPLDELLQARRGLLARADAVDGLHFPVIDLEDRLHREERPEERRAAGDPARPLEVLEHVRRGEDVHLAGQAARERGGLVERVTVASRPGTGGRDERDRARHGARIDDLDPSVGELLTRGARDRVRARKLARDRDDDHLADALADDPVVYVAAFAHRRLRRPRLHVGGGDLRVDLLGGQVDARGV